MRKLPDRLTSSRLHPGCDLANMSNRPCHTCCLSSFSAYPASLRSLAHLHQMFSICLAHTYVLLLAVWLHTAIYRSLYSLYYCQAACYQQLDVAHGVITCSSGMQLAPEMISQLSDTLMSNLVRLTPSAGPRTICAVAPEKVQAPKTALLHLRLHCLHLKVHCLHLRLRCLHLRLHCLHLRVHCLHLRLLCLHFRVHCLHLKVHCLHPRLLCLYPRLHCLAAGAQAGPAAADSREAGCSSRPAG